MSFRRHYRDDYRGGRHHYYHRPRWYYPLGYDYLLYEAMRDRDRYRDLYLDKLYYVDKCNPYYAAAAGCRI
jgi:hypothetical protein